MSPLRPMYLLRTLLKVVLVLAVGVLQLKAQPTRPITVADTISMTELVGQGAGLHDFVQFSPDGERFAVTIEHGNLERNERVFSLLVFRTGEVFDKSAKTVAVLASPTNDDAIADVRWLDNHTLTFLGTRRGAGTQVYAIDVRTNRLMQLSKHPARVNAYAVAPGLERIIYTADADLTTEVAYSRQHGFAVTDQSLPDILLGHFDARRLTWRDLSYEIPQETFIRRLPSSKTSKIKDANQLITVVPNALFPYSPNAVSPNGRFAIVQGSLPLPNSWQSFVTAFPSTVGTQHRATAFVLVNLVSGESSLLLDAPSSPYLTSVVWAPDSRSAVLVNTFLPHEPPIGENQTAWRKQASVAEVNLATREVTVLQGPTLNASTTQDIVCAEAIGWNAKRGVTLGISKAPDVRGGTCDLDTVVTYQKIGLEWHEVDVRDVNSALRSTPSGRITISIDEGLNKPPNLQAIDHDTGRTKLLTDLNPQFRSLRFAKVNLISWTAGDGTKWSGDLYLPPRPKPPQGYPLVIQTHGCTTDKFDITGFGPGGTTGYAAQVLASRGVVVLQEGHCASPEQLSPFPYYSKQNAEREVLGYESAIDLLDKEGLIDRTRLGLQGHSATAWTVLYAAAHPKPGYHYGAIVSTARGDLGYFSYLVTAYGHLWSAQGNGGAPVGENFDTFRRNALPFNLEHVATPIMSQEPDGLRYVPLMWEVHEILRMMGKPEEFIIFPEGTHNLVKPWERLTSQESAVDWFCFWLNGEEDPSQAKAEQFKRWHELKKVQEENDNKAKGGSAN